MSLQITALYAALNGLLLIVLSWMVVSNRRASNTGRGAGDNPVLERAIRAHGNFTEYVPLGLLLLAIAELNGLPGIYIHGFGAALFIARVFHAWGLSRRDGRTFGRFWGTLVTWLVILGLSLILLTHRVLGLTA